MTDERPGSVPAVSTLVPNLEAQRAYAATIAPPPRPPLPSAQAGWSRLAGGLGGAMMLVGVDLVVFAILLLVLQLAIESFAGWLGSHVSDVVSAAGASVEQLSAAPWPWTVTLASVVGVALATTGALVSVRILRAAGLERPAWLAFVAFGLAFGVRLVLDVFTAPFSSLLSALYERGLAGPAEGGVELVGTVVAFAIAFATNVAIAAATGMLAWWAVVHATRPAAQEPEPGEPSRSALPQRHRLPG